MHSNGNGLPETVAEQKAPPYNLDAELAVLGAMLLDDSTIPAVRAIVRPSDFFRDTHQILFAAICELFDERGTVDVVLVADRLESQGLFARIGGDEALAEMATHAPHAANATYHAEIILEKSKARAALDVAGRLIDGIYRRREVASTLLDRMGRDLHTLIGRGNAAGALVRAADVEPTEVCWLWPGRVPRGYLTTFAGPGGLGKTLITLDMTARITTGRSWPDLPEGSNPVGSVLLISSEDNPSDMTIPRLMAMGADLSRVWMLSPDVLARWTLADVGDLERFCAAIPELAMVVIDPPTAHVGDTDDHKNAPLRRLLAPLAAFALKQELAITMVTHISKSTSGKAADRVIGSVAWINSVRAAWIVVKDQENRARRRFLPLKKNIGPEVSGLAYTIATDRPVILWDQAPELMDADDAVREERPARATKVKVKKKIQECEEWLAALLATEERGSKEIIELGEEEGFKRDMLFRAKATLGIKARKSGFGDEAAWSWYAPDAGFKKNEKSSDSCYGSDCEQADMDDWVDNPNIPESPY